jgi:hypothetical protein
MHAEADVLQFPIKTKLVCTACGATGTGSCNCNAPYVAPSERAEAAVKANPGKSDRDIAREEGVSPTTVGKARKQLSSTGQLKHVEKRTGKDGRKRAMPKPATPKPAPPIKAVDEKGRVAGVDIKVHPAVWQAFGVTAQREQKSPTDLINELITGVVEPSPDLRVELPRSTQEKLDAAIRQYKRKLDAEHAERMRGVDEEVRLRVVAQGKEYVADMKVLRDKAWEDEKHWREMNEQLKHPLTVDQFNLLRKCLHQRGIAAEERDFDAAFDLIQTKKTLLAGLK